MVELASGKGAFALHLARKFGCRVDCFEVNPEFVDYSTDRAVETDLARRVRFTCCNVESLEVQMEKYDVGVCLGALYIFREAGWRVLAKGVKNGGFLAVSDLFCKKVPPPKEVVETFFEEDEGGVVTLEDVRRWYANRGLKIVREAECSREAWLEYYDLTKAMLHALERKYKDDVERQAEIDAAFAEDRLVRKYVDEYLGYMTFIMKKTR